MRSFRFSYESHECTQQMKIVSYQLNKYFSTLEMSCFRNHKKIQIIFLQQPNSMIEKLNRFIYSCTCYLVVSVWSLNEFHMQDSLIDYVQDTWNIPKKMIRLMKRTNSVDHLATTW